jgi:hypothetical protein
MAIGKVVFRRPKDTDWPVALRQNLNKKAGPKSRTGFFVPKQALS